MYAICIYNLCASVWTPRRNISSLIERLTLDSQLYMTYMPATAFLKLFVLQNQHRTKNKASCILFVHAVIIKWKDN